MSPAGIWTTIDDNTGDPKSLIRIWEKDGRKLKVRGYIGIALLGRTQYWIRAK